MNEDSKIIVDALKSSIKNEMSRQSLFLYITIVILWVLTMVGISEIVNTNNEIIDPLKENNKINKTIKE